ncbi:MAG TPA: ACT domain-containing protein, partial [Campylobacterales bacterium]|nr:ACT domain-containing protein [Campylobacterales bacterium]
EIPDSIRPYLNLIQKIGFMSAKLNRGNIKSIKVYLEGDEVEKYSKSLTTSAIIGVLKESLGEQVNYVNSEFIAKERGIAIENRKFSNKSGFINRVGVKLTTNKDIIQIAGTIFGEAEERIIEINGFDLDIRPQGNMVLFTNSDIPGVIGDVGSIFAKYGVNIADFRLGRDSNGKALAVIHTDGEAPEEAINELSKLEACISIQTVSIV